MKTFFTLIFFIFSFSTKSDEMKPYTVFLKEGSVLIQIKNKSEIILPKGIYAKVLEVNPKKRDLFNVYDKNGRITYQVNVQSIVEVEEDIKILPTINAETIYPPKNSFKANNAFAQFNSQVNLHIDSLEALNLDNPLEANISSKLANRYEARTLYVSKFPIEFGLVLNYQQAEWANQTEEIIENVKLSILSVGPQFKYKTYTNKDLNLYALLSTEIAPLYQYKSSLNTDKYSAVLFDLGIESEWRSSLGILSFGSHYRRHEIALTETTRNNLELVPKDISLNSFGLMIGYKIMWEL